MVVVASSTNCSLSLCEWGLTWLWFRWNFPFLSPILNRWRAKQPPQHFIFHWQRDFEVTTPISPQNLWLYILEWQPVEWNEDRRRRWMHFFMVHLNYMRTGWPRPYSNSTWSSHKTCNFCVTFWLSVGLTRRTCFIPTNLYTQWSAETFFSGRFFITWTVPQ